MEKNQEKLHWQFAAESPALTDRWHDWPLRSQSRNQQSPSQQSNMMHTGAHTLPHCSVPVAHVILLVLLFITFVYEL